MTLAGIRFCFDLIPMELIFVGTGGYAAEHIAFALGRIIQYAIGWNEEALGVTLHTVLFRFLIYPVTAGVIFSLLIRKNRGKGDFKSKDSRMVRLALIMLMAAIILSVFYSSGIVMEQGTVASEVICPVYSALCCMLVLFMEFYVLRENRMERMNREPEERRIVSLLIKRTGAMVLIHMENQCGTPPEFRDGFPVTDKSDKTAHGSYWEGTKYTNALYTPNSDSYADFEYGQHYLELSRTERDLVDLVTSNFDNVIVVYNGANSMEMGWTEDYEQIKGVLLCAGPGATGFNALGKIISGEVNPSGKTVDLWASDLIASP